MPDRVISQAASSEPIYTNSLSTNLGFGREDMVVEPGHEGEIVGHTPEQGHGCMGMGIDEAGHDDIVGSAQNLGNIFGEYRGLSP